MFGSSPENGNGLIALTSIGTARYNLAGSTPPNIPLKQVGWIPEGDAGYGSHQGLAELRSSVGRLCEVGSDQVIITSGATFAIFLVAFSLYEGGSVLITRPCYPPAYQAPAALGVRVDVLQLQFDRRYQLDFLDIATRIRRDVKVVSIASPQNPSGISIDAADILELSKVLASRAPDAMLLVDETFREASHGAIASSVASLAPNIIATGSLSKVYGVPGLRIGWVATTNELALRRMLHANAVLAHSSSVLDQQVAERILDQRQTILTQQAAEIRERWQVVLRWLRAHQEELEWHAPDAGAMCCFRLKADRFSEARVSSFGRSLRDHEVGLANGSLFGDEERVFRLGFGQGRRSDLDKALNALSSALRQGREAQQMPSHADRLESDPRVVRNPAGAQAWSAGAIRDLTQGLIDCSLAGEKFTHEAHLLAALCILKEHSEINADDELPDIIRRYNVSQGGANTDDSGFHATITAFYLRAIRSFLDSFDKGQGLEKLARSLLSSPLIDKDFPLSFYSRERLFSVAARRSPKNPDLRPLEINWAADGATAGDQE